jgi:hypothetical protein
LEPEPTVEPEPIVRQPAPDPKPTEHMAHRPPDVGPESVDEALPVPESQVAEPAPTVEPTPAVEPAPVTRTPTPDPKPNEHMALRPPDFEPVPTPAPVAAPTPERSGSEVYGVPAEVYNHLPEEDRQAVRDDHDRLLAERLRELARNLPPEDQAAIREELEELEPPPADTEADGPTSGPAMGDGVPLQYLPFPDDPGSVSLTVPGAPPAPTGPLRIGIEATGTTELGDEHLTPEGRRQALALEGQLQMTGGLETERGHAGGSLERYLSESRRYEVSVSPERAQEITDGGEAPNPVDPRSLQPGESVTLREDFFTGTNLEATYRAIALSDDFGEGTRVSTGIQRVDENTVQLIVGDEDVVAEALRLGVGTEDLNAGLTASRELAAGELTTVELDVSTSAGWDAYQRFVNEGALPAGPDAESSDTDRTSYSSSTGWDVNLGPLSWAGTLHDNASSVDEIEHSDGSTEYKISVREGDVTIDTNRTETAAGLQLAENSLLLEGADYSTLGVYQQLQGQEPVQEGTHDVRVDLTDSELEAMREAAVDQLVQATERDGNDMSGEEIQAQLRADPYDAVAAMMHTEQMIAAARTPGDVLHALSLEARGNPDALLDFLTRFDINTTAVRHGDDASPLEESELPGRLSFVETD